MNRVCFSGGADGSDLRWGIEAKKHGYDVVHYSFSGHHTSADRADILVLSDQQLRLANKFLTETAVSIGRFWPPKSAYVRKLLQRNFWQVRQTEAVYAVSSLTREGHVAGGTGWAVGMYLSCGLQRRVNSCFLFDQERRHWFNFRPGSGWVPIDRPPPPPDFFTGIGSRDLNAYGERAIEEAFSGRKDAGAGALPRGDG